MAAEAAAEPPFSQFQEKKDGYTVTGRVYRTDEREAVVEVWPQPRRANLKVEKIELVSPSGKRYRVRDVEHFPMSQLGQRRAGYERKTSSRRLEDWFIGTAHASQTCPPGCTHENCGRKKEVSTEDAAAFAGFGVLAGMAAGAEKEWVYGGTVMVDPEDGAWRLVVQAADSKGEKHTFTHVIADEPAPDAGGDASSAGAFEGLFRDDYMNVLARFQTHKVPVYRPDRGPIEDSTADGAGTYLIGPAADAQNPEAASVE